MDKILIYPYGTETESIIKYFYMLKNIQIVGVIKLRGWFDGRKSFICEGKEIPIYYDLKKALENLEINGIYFADFQKELSFEKYYLPLIKFSIEQDKKIICGKKIKNEIDKYFKNDVEVQYVSDTGREMDYDSVDKLIQINTPVIYIGSLIDGIDSFEVQLAIREQLQKRTDKISQIGTKEYSHFFGMDVMPRFMLETAISEKNKILFFNSFLKEIELQDHPDLIIAGIPNELFPISTKYVSNFGMCAIEMFFATIPDVLIIILPYENYSTEDIEEMKESILSRFGTKVDIFVLSNKRLLIDETEISQEAKFLTVVEEEMSMPNAENITINDYSNMADIIIHKLIQNGKLKSI